MRLSRALAASALSTLALALPAAPAAGGVTSVSAAPASTQAGAHANLTIDMAFSPGDDVRDLVIHLPKGFVGNPLAPALCTQAQFAADACPAASRVGTNTVTATVTVNPTLGIRQVEQVTGSVFNLEPRAGEPARLGVLLPATAAAGGVITTQPVRLQSVVSVRTGSDYGLDSTLSGLPRTIQSNIGELPAHIDRIQLTLLGQTPGAAKPYLTNPTTCVPATTTVDTTSYCGQTASSASSYTPTNCDALTFAPKITGSLVGAGPKQFPQLTTVVSQEADEATARKVVVTLPEGVSPDLKALSPTCADAEFVAGTCPASTQVGTAAAETPLLADPLTGPVFLVSPPGGGLPGLGMDLSGLLPVKLRASVRFSGTRVESTLDDLPDVPLSRFTLVLGGGERKMLVATKDLCASPGTIDGTFTAQAGMEVTASSTVTATDCAPGRGNSGGGDGDAAGPGSKSRRPKVTAKLSRRGALVVTAKLPRRAGALRRMRVALPKGLSADRGKRLRAQRRGGARKLKVRVAPRHLTVQPRRLAKRPRVKVVAKTTSGRTYRVRARLR